MTEVSETIIEEDNKNINEAVPEKVEELKTEEVKVDIPAETPKEEPKEEAPKEDEQFKNKTDRMKNKKVKCEGCQAEMTLKSLRYSHKCNGKTEDKPIKPKPKTRTVAVKPIENQVIKTIQPTRFKEKENIKPKENEQYSEVIEVRTKAKPVIMEEPVRELSTKELLLRSYNEMKKLRHQEHQEKINGFKSRMF